MLNCARFAWNPICKGIQGICYSYHEVFFGTTGTVGPCAKEEFKYTIFDPVGRSSTEIDLTTFL